MPRLLFTLLTALIAALPITAHAERVRDIGAFQGVRSNQLTGYGIVVGLSGTGDDATNYERVMYEGFAPHRVPVMVDTIGAQQANIRAGKLKALAVTTAQRSASLPEIPAMSETLKGFEVDTWWGLVAPAATPPAVVAKLHQAFAAALNAPETKTRFGLMMAEPVVSTPEQFSAFMKRELAKYEPVVKATGARVD